MKKHKYPYGIIGNCAYLALIDTQANVGWMCWPRFDSSFIFGTILDEEKGGRFSIQLATGNYETKQQYIQNTNILETIFTGPEGSFKVVDFAPRFENNGRMFKPLMLFRKIVPIEGRPSIKVVCQPRGAYGEKEPKKVFGSNHIRYEGLDEQVRLTTNISLTFLDNEQGFVLNETKYMALTWGLPLEGPLESTFDIFEKKTTNYWHRWVAYTHTEHFHQEAIIRSALALKIHQYQDTGAIIAAATTSLPEFPGSTRNWDYRFCWFRDAHYTLKALNDLGHFRILKDYANYVENIAINSDGRLNPLNPIGLDRIPVETTLPLKGYKGEQPVRIGNQAFEHIQNDVYGQVLVTLLPFFTDQRLKTKDAPNLIAKVNYCLKMIEQTMDEPDNGLWEFRGINQLHSYTFLFHWAGSQAAKKIALALNDEVMLNKSKELIQLSSDMLERCYDEERGVYTQAVGSSNLDASLLQLINMGYLDPMSEKAKQHVKVLEGELLAKDGLFYRYIHKDDFGEPESTFLICAFWYVETLARMNRISEATQFFENLLKHGNHLGLLSEDVHSKSGSQWGNFPQTYSHVGLINAAFTIARKQDKPIYLT